MECREHREWGECEKWKMPPNIPGNARFHLVVFVFPVNQEN